MRSFGMALARWFSGTLLGVVAAGLLIGVVALLVGAESIVGPLTLLAVAFGVAFFPAAFSVRTRTPRGVLRRALLGYALESLIAIAAAGYRVATNTSLVGSAYLGWVSTLTGIGERVAAFAAPSSGMILSLAIGVVVLVVCLALWYGLRPAARRAASQPAPARPSAPPAVAEPKKAQAQAPAAKPPATPQKALPAEDDAKWMADLDAQLNDLSKKLPPKQ